MAAEPAAMARRKPLQCTSRNSSGTIRSRVRPIASAWEWPNAVSAPLLQKQMVPEVSAITIAVVSNDYPRNGSVRQFERELFWLHRAAPAPDDGIQRN